MIANGTGAERQLIRPIRDTSELRERHGGHFFDAGTMRSFGSRLAPSVIPAAGGGRTYFVTSERDAGPYPAWDARRRYTVRVMTDATGDVDTPEPDGFGAYVTLRAAMTAARKLASADTTGAGPAPCAIDSHRRYGGPAVTHRGRAYCAACLDSAARYLAERRRASEGPVPRSECVALLRGTRAMDIEYRRSIRRRTGAAR